jgi:uncharacterized iron-regulated membrane protein
MKKTFRQSMSWLHTWAGLSVGWILYFIFVTGTAGYFDSEIDRWMQPEIPHSIGVEGSARMLELAEQRLHQVAPNAQWWHVEFPVDRNRPFLEVDWEAGEEVGLEILHPQTGQPIAVRETGGGRLLYQMHYRLHYMSTSIAYWLVSLCGMFMLVALISAIIIHKRIFKDFFTFRPKKGQRSWLDLHNVFSVLALPFHLMITFSGLLFLAFTFMPMIIAGSYGNAHDSRQTFFDEAFNYYPSVSADDVPAKMLALTHFLSDAESRWGQENISYLNIDNPADANARVELHENQLFGLTDGRTLTYDGISGEWLHGSGESQSGPILIRDVMLNLHEGLFAGTFLRWFYFLSGFLGSAMIATGLILWTTKRRANAQRDKQPHKGLAVVEHLNIGSIIGLPVGIAVYFWANRVLPIDVPERAELEVLALFISWGLCFLYPLLRSVKQAWIELCWLAALLYGLLPILNGLTTARHLGVSLAQQDWVMAGFDISMLLLGIALALTAIRLQNLSVKSGFKNLIRVCSILWKTKRHDYS